MEQMAVPGHAVRRKRTPLVAATTAKRRRPVDWRRYTKRVQAAQVRLPRYEHPLLVSLAVSLLFAVAGMSLLAVIGGGLGAGIQQTLGTVVSALPQGKGQATIDLGEQRFTVSAAPVLDPLPEFTKGDKITVAGKIPSFAALAGRQVEITLNGTLVATVPFAADGRFTSRELTLPEGTSTVTARLVEGTSEVAVTSATVVVDRAAPQLSITRPRAGETVDTEVVIEGRTDPDAEVTVSGRALRPNPDGVFTDRINAPVGPLTLQIAAKDRAGNETKTALTITVRQATAAPAGGVTLGVSLDRTRVRPGETVVVKAIATEGGKPRADLTVTLQVGVFTVGTYKTDATGIATIGFAAPDHEADDVAIVVLGGGTAARATLQVKK